MEKNFDVVIIGSGPGGYVTAIRAAQLGFKTAVIERESLGGVCLNWGCIPTKALLKSSEVYKYIKKASSFGVTVENATPDIKAMVDRSRTVAKQLSGGVTHLLKKNKVEVIMGSGSVASAGVVNVTMADNTTTTVKAKHIILATGSRARVIQGFEPDGKFIWTYREALVANEIPKTMLVMGSGAIGMEFANFFAAIGTKVTVVEMVDRILPAEDAEISALAKKAFEKQDITILTSTKVIKADKKTNTVAVTIEQNGKQQVIEVEKIISAVGIVPNTENLGLEKLGIKTERGIVTVNNYSQTSVAGIYAIGDITQGPWLAHKASHEGVICVEKIAGLNPHPLDRSKLPGCTYTYPQVASVGLSEQKAKELKIDVKIGRFPFMGNGKAIAVGESDGLIKTIFNAKTGELIGAHLIGFEVVEMIQGFVIAMNLETTQEELIHTVFAHPTISEGMHESVLDSVGKMIHF